VIQIQKNIESMELIVILITIQNNLYACKKSGHTLHTNVIIY